MKTVISLGLVLALVSLSACTPKVNDPADVQAVKQTMEVNRHDVVPPNGRPADPATALSRARCHFSGRRSV